MDEHSEADALGDERVRVDQDLAVLLREHVLNMGEELVDDLASFLPISVVDRQVLKQARKHTLDPSCRGFSCPLAHGDPLGDLVDHFRANALPGGLKVQRGAQT